MIMQKAIDSSNISYCIFNQQFEKMATKQKQNRVKESQMKQKQQIHNLTNDASLWYYQIFQNRNKYKKTPTSIQQYKQSHPYRLVISKLQGLSLTKKSGVTDFFLNLTGVLFTDQFQILGAPFYYQSQYSFGRTENKWQHPIAFYLHSRIDKNYEGLYLSIKFQVIQIKESFVENIHQIGVMIIKNPFIEQANKILPVYRDLNQIQFGYSSPQVKTKVLNGSSPIVAEYSIESMLQLKKLVKLIPQNAIFSHQDHITGIHNDYLPKEIQEIHINDARSVQVIVQYLQIHISQKLQFDLINYFKKNYPNQKNNQIKIRKIAIGFHNQYTLVNGATRKLENIGKEIAGQTKIYIFEALKEGEILKIPFFCENQSSLGMMAVGLIYQIAGRELEVACTYFLPSDNGEQINEKMIMGEILGSTYPLVSFPTQQAPTLILDYNCNLKEMQVSMKDDGLSPAKQIKGGKNYVNQELLIEQRQKLKKEIEKQKLQLLKEKEEMEKLKLQKDVHYQAQFQKKFQVEKENLYKRQQMIQNQYKEQVQRQIRQKFQLEQEVKKMLQRIKHLEDGSLKKGNADSYQSSRVQNFNTDRIESPNQSGVQMPPIRQRMDPGYVIEPQNPVPVKKVREIIQKSSKVNPQLVKQSQQMFNFASKFTFTFTSIIWSHHIEIPKSIYLLIRFFNQRELRTESIGYIQSGEGGYHQLIKLSHFNKGFENKQPSYCFTIDPSEYHQPALIQKDLTQYLYHNNSIIDIFSGDTHLYIGQINIKLKQLLRGMKSQTLIAKQISLVKIKNKQTLGVMQILIRNEQASCKQQVSLKHEKRVKEIKKKIVSNNPIHIMSQEKRFTQLSNKPDNQIQQIRNTNMNMNRQELRIKKFKEQKTTNSFAATANNFAQLDQTQKGFALTEIASYKQKKIQDFLKGAYEQLLNEKIIISAHYGKAVTFPFLFTNMSQTPSSYKISILYTENDTQKELTVVKSNKEWRYLTNKHNYTQPKRYDMIGQNNTFFLQPGQSIPLIFKFLSFKNQVGKIGNLFTKQRLINITICKQQNNWIAGGFSLLVNLHEQIIHHSYILYQPGDQIVDLIVPVIYSQTENNSNTKKLYLTNQDSNTSAVWLNPYQILIRIPTPKIMEKLKFHLLLYQDQFFCQLRQNWLIQVYAYQGVCTTFRSDFNTRFKITLPWSAVPAHLGLLSLDKAAGCLQLFASNSGLVFKNNIIELESDRKDQGSYEIWCELIGSENTLKNFEITCVSGQDSQLLYGWVVTVYPYTPRS